MTIVYKRSRFSTRLPAGYLYSPAHYWLREASPGVWQVGFTKFAARMLGDIVECEFKVPAGASIETGQVIGWTEGFKAMSDIYSAASGEFLGANPALAREITLIDHDPYGEGWLYNTLWLMPPKPEYSIIRAARQSVLRQPDGESPFG